MVRKRDIKHFRDLEVYKRAFAAAMEIFQITKNFKQDQQDYWDNYLRASVSRRRPLNFLDYIRK